MKPLEPGCVAMVVNCLDPKEIGKTGTCVRMVPKGTEVTQGEYAGMALPGDYWLLGELNAYYNANCLLRIDGGELIDQEQEEGVAV
ncbi:hypothetical protein MHM84_03560 [Halomonas sp. McH1-25]|uniref:hypothetical protein n=1 Tax=unclassified Halomonas TaxID=2609666 RepID=UPI001EF3D8D6|nr:MULTISPECIES: hypothetical protein [unclassified Halomonas]MCG7598849.1 hypothetical protein [Halomonas sp. McH1-25]MCP1340812.1 hypothetical protein [Halomonas sp. FL8]MCP1361305.1 hypothetical protein [Halomonas sp. BBD45]MCP1364336.1 hypothetical protein [Halomonas sp. BBD48]